VKSTVNMWDPIDVERAKVWVKAGNPICPTCGEPLSLRPATREADALDGAIRFLGSCPHCHQVPVAFFVQQE